MSKSLSRFAFGSALGFAIAISSILGGLLLEDGELRDVGQTTAALIVFGGTLGAVMVSIPSVVLRTALRRACSLLREEEEDASTLIDQLVVLTKKARSTGIVSLEADVQKINEPFLQKALMLLVDGVDASEIRRILELDLIVSENEADNDAKVFESAGAYAPTVGIIGAVMGLIQVMKHLESLSDVGHGIAVAFVATVYGVGLANLILLPIANRIRVRSHLTSHFRELVIEGVISVQSGKNPQLMRRMLSAFVSQPLPAESTELRTHKRTNKAPTSVEPRLL